MLVRLLRIRANQSFIRFLCKTNYKNKKKFRKKERLATKIHPKVIIFCTLRLCILKNEFKCMYICTCTCIILSMQKLLFVPDLYPTKKKEEDLHETDKEFKIFELII